MQEYFSDIRMCSICVVYDSILQLKSFIELVEDTRQSKASHANIRSPQKTAHRTYEMWSPLKTRGFFLDFDVIHLKWLVGFY